MKISELLKIEPFDDVFMKTMSGFLSEKYKKKINVIWLPASLYFRIFPRKDLWICNGKINAIYKKGLDKKAQEIIRGEYSFVPGSPFISLIRRLYIFLCFAPFVQYLLATHFVSIRPTIGDGENMLILGGGTKIRVVDVNLGHMFVVKKSNASGKSLENEREASLSWEQTGAAAHLSKIRREEWFSQELFFGMPPNRFPNRVAQEIYKSANLKLHSYLYQYSRVISKSRYFEKLKAEVEWYTYNVRSNILSVEANRFYNVLLNISMAGSGPELLISKSHGDFHPGNIISNGAEFRIIDWEFADERILGYDFFVFSLGSRAIKNLDQRLGKLLDSRSSVVETELGVIWNDKRGFCFANFSIFLIEDALLFLKQARARDNDVVDLETSKRLALISSALVRVIDLEGLA